ncbi:MAG: NAD-dependent epimerase/dehydratase family protein [Candidatus Paceibacterota bacterium]
MKTKTILITGAAGYVGAMLCNQFSRRQDVGRIIALDKEDMPELLQGQKKITWLKANTADADWLAPAARLKPDLVIHTAWQIRELYGEKKKQWRWNVDGSKRVFDFVFSTPSVEKLIYFSTVASYGADPTNRLDYRFTERDPLRPSDYLYAEEKRQVELLLQARYREAPATGHRPAIFVLRPAAITGPRGRFMRVRFGLQAVLSGQLKATLTHRLISLLVSFVPVTKKWCRQFIHEDDVNDIVTTLAFNYSGADYEVFNICPPGPIVTGEQMATAVGKKSVMVSPWLIWLVFFVMWHLSRGRVPTSRGGWKSYAYPIAVDGSKLSQQTGYRYRYRAKEAFTKKTGRYAKYIKKP